MQNKITFQSKDGTKLADIWHLTEKSSEKAIILAHGITGDKNEQGIFIELAESLKDHDYAVFRFDFRGHGESEGNSADMTIAGEIEDLNAAVNEVIKKGFENIGLIGASFGGSISTIYMAKDQDIIKCLCLWNPVLNYDHCFLNPFLPWLSAKKDMMKKDLIEKGWTTIGSRKFILGKKLFEEMAKIFPFEELQNINHPLLILHGDKDEHVPYEDSKQYIQGVGKLITIHGAHHGFHDEKKHRQQAIQETLAFFQENLK